MKRFFAISIVTTLLSITHLYAQKMNTDTQIFHPDFRTLKVQVENDFMSPPIIHLNGNDRITIMFDELSDDVRYMQYRLVHCNADWQPSMLLDSEFVDGFNIANVDDYAFSSNTFIHYVNYLITIPNDNIAPLVSGNYLLQVFDESDPDETLLQARFYVDEAQVTVTGEATSRTDLGVNDIFQQVNFSVAQNQYKITDPFSELIAVVKQNGRTDNSVTLRNPQRIQASQIIYEHLPQLIFKAGNEFRRFETVRTNYPGMHVDSTRYIGNSYNAFLQVDEERASASYLFDRTQNGRYCIDEYNSTDPNLGADYIMTHFALDVPQVMNADIYICGELSLNHFDDSNKMEYNYDTGLYEKTLQLKQGSYNYQYLAVPHRSATPVGDTSLIEGNHYETINEYVIKIYHHTPGSRADRLIGSCVVYSGL